MPIDCHWLKAPGPDVLSFCLSTLDFATEFLCQKIYSLEFNFSGSNPLFLWI
ncbi:hypothetical protein MICAC_4670006 [Microcystis aeruginosa PCC 9443]|uniref:Uncharacterized protein n=1 Tax=Microcystis aeruginosa PCC 9443 TaxID=1160281 RepID=I4G6H3_MICAE|nr:hypothetical protein MICAC_4670006 [Microcystis aeruginosa PCC 9443]